MVSGGGLVYKDRPDYQDDEHTDADGNFLTFPHLYPDVTEVDLRMFYSADPWHFSLSATNVFGTRYLSPAFAYFAEQNTVNPPRRILATVTRNF